MIKLKSLIKEVKGIITKDNTSSLKRLEQYLTMTNVEKMIFIENLFAKNHVKDWIKYGDSWGTECNNIDIINKSKILNDKQLSYYIKTNYPIEYKIYLKYLWVGVKSGDMFEPDLISWRFLKYKKTLYNHVMIHFSNYVDDIIKEQKFKFGINNFGDLPASNPESGDRKSVLNGIYSFAFDVRDINHINKKVFDLYGGRAVIFMADGIKIYNMADEEYPNQIIFVTKTAKNIKEYHIE